MLKPMSTMLSNISNIIAIVMILVGGVMHVPWILYIGVTICAMCAIDAAVSLWILRRSRSNEKKLKVQG